MPPQPRQPKPPKAKTVTWREWKGVNLTDARIAIGEDEFAWLENAITIGKGAVQIVPPIGGTVATIASGIERMWGFTLRGNPVLITVNGDGSASQITPAGVVTDFAPPGTFQGDHHATIWRDAPVLLLCEHSGLFSWDGIVFGGNIISGLAVTPSAPTAMTVEIAAGDINYWGTTVSVLATTLAISAADPTLPRIDLISIDPGGAPIVTTGTPAQFPLEPPAPVNAGLPNVVVAEITVAAGTTTIELSGITDIRLYTTTIGQAIAVFEGRLWTARNRTISYTAPLTYNDNTQGNGAGQTNITDDAFAGNVVALYSALEQLWIIGESAIEALANVGVTGIPPSITTSFTITNIVTNVGTTFPNSVIAYFRALTFLAPFGSYALSGVTPQKLSDKLDGLFPDIETTGDVPAAVAIVENLLCLLFLVTYTGNSAQAGPPPRPLILGFTSGKWFFASQGDLTWITSIVVGGVAQAWGTDGTAIFELFAGDGPTVYKVQSGLRDFGAPTTEKEMLKVGFEFQAPAPITPRVTVDSEHKSVVVPVSGSNIITALINNQGELMTLINNLSQPLYIVVGGTILSRNQTSLFGRYLGWTLTGTDEPYRLQAVEAEIVPSREWSTPT